MATIFNPTGKQLSDIIKYAEALSAVDEALNEIEPHELGDGFRATLLDRIPVYTDARGERELLGWLVPGYSTWEFTQKEEAA